MKTKIFLLAAVISIGLSSCDVANQVMTEVMTTPTTTANPLTQNEVTAGLKRALCIGTVSAVSDLSATNGFLGNPNYKILLPKEANIILENKNNPLLQAVGIDKLIDNVESSMNLAAEKAVVTAKPIFINAITNMSIQDAFSILNGGDTAASNFLRRTTYTQLYNQFKPEVAKTLNQPLFNGISTDKTWSTLTTAYNGVAAYVPSLTPVNTKLDDYVTDKALAALFDQVKQEEVKIRKDPTARVEDILRRVFGS